MEFSGPLAFMLGARVLKMSLLIDLGKELIIVFQWNQMVSGNL